MKDNGILVWLNFYNGSVDFFGCDVYEFDSMVEYIDFDTSKTKEICFCQLGNERILYSLDFNQIPGLRRQYNPEDFTLIANGVVEVIIGLTTGEEIIFNTNYDRFWINHSFDEIQVIQHETKLLKV